MIANDRGLVTNWGLVEAPLSQSISHNIPPGKLTSTLLWQITMLSTMSQSLGIPIGPPNVNLATRVRSIYHEPYGIRPLVEELPPLKNMTSSGGMK